MKIFVYGSLKPGGWSHHLLDNSVGDPQAGSVEGTLYDAGSFPALKDDNGGIVQGFLYNVNDGHEVPLLDRLDSLEGYPTLFDRRLMPITVGNCTETAIVYFGKNEGLFDESRIVSSGVWDV